MADLNGPPKPPKLLDQAIRCIGDKHYSVRTEEAYVYWIRWFSRFHQLRHPRDMGAAEATPPYHSAHPERT